MGVIPIPLTLFMSFNKINIIDSGLTTLTSGFPITKLLGSSPVPVLATLFLLSYAKVLSTIIAALSLTEVQSSYFI